jgi:mannose-6-phosphate isomerase-like protein (cupin superfamily)
MLTDIAPPSSRGYVLAADQGLAPDQPDLKASADFTGGQLTVFTLSVDGGPPRHTHTREDESTYLFSGVLEVECDGEEFEAAPGSFVFLPRQRPHKFRSVGGTARGLLIITPGGLEKYFAALHATLKAGDSSQPRPQHVLHRLTHTQIGRREKAATSSASRSPEAPSSAPTMIMPAPATCKGHAGGGSGQL